MHDLADQLDAFEETVPGLAGRLDHDSVAIAELLRVCACGTAVIALARLSAT